MTGSCLKKMGLFKFLSTTDDLLAVSFNFTFSAPSDFKIKSISMHQSIIVTVKIY